MGSAVLPLKPLFLSAILSPLFSCFDNFSSDLGFLNANLSRKGVSAKSFNGSPLYDMSPPLPSVNFATDGWK